jgi:hypothetical protein
MGLGELFIVVAIGACKLAALVSIVFVGTRLALWSHDRSKQAGEG